MTPATVRACKVRRWDDEQRVWVSRIYGYQARTVDEPVGRVHKSCSDAIRDARAYNAEQRAKSPGAV